MAHGPEARRYIYDTNGTSEDSYGGRKAENHHPTRRYRPGAEGKRRRTQLAHCPDGHAFDTGISGAFTGDIPTFDKTQADTRKEEALFAAWVATLPESTCREWSGLLEEMDALQTLEAKIYKALDKMEAVISHNESDIATWLPLEYDLQLTYGQENVEFSPYMQGLKGKINQDTREKIAREAK